MPQLSFRVDDSSQIGEARRCAVRVAQDAGMGETARGQTSLVATELASNLVKHGAGGELLVQRWPDDRGTGIEIISVDAGPGMADVERCLRDGFSTAATSGTGLGAVRRLAAEFDVYSRPGQGTVVLARVGTPTPGPGTRFEWGAVCLPMPGETVCGDAWRVGQTGAELALMVVDGLGHGPLAAEAAVAAARLFLATEALRPQQFLQQAHAELASTRGAAVVAATVAADRARLTFAGVGNVSGTLLWPGARRGLLSHHGTVGVQVRKVQEFDYPWPEHAVLIVHSDGLQTRWSGEEQHDLLARHPAVVAAALYRRFRRGRDDVTILVVRMRK